MNKAKILYIYILLLFFVFCFLIFRNWVVTRMALTLKLVTLNKYLNKSFQWWSKYARGPVVLNKINKDRIAHLRWGIMVISNSLIYVQYIPRNMHTTPALLCFVVVTYWLIYPYPSDLLHWHCGNITIAPVPAKQPWWIWVNASCEFIMNDYITTTKQSTTKPCANFLGYTVIPNTKFLDDLSHWLISANLKIFEKNAHVHCFLQSTECDILLWISHVHKLFLT